ncbi:hypothetical protein F5882DRAFT_438137 [Hyaloscypha sp. PMI_1271]|nr:hypothetical protein F5882DRAFT_438137 [Hyaloscypha sp. PMI_1271]
MACTAKRCFRRSELDMGDFEVIREDREKVLVGGRSSGSNLAAGVALRDMEVHVKSHIKGLFLDLPHVVHTDASLKELIASGKASYEKNIDAPILPLSRIN